MNELLANGKAANTEGQFLEARDFFEAAYALSERIGLLVSAANMRLKLKDYRVWVGL